MLAQTDVLAQIDMHYSRCMLAQTDMPLRRLIYVLAQIYMCESRHMCVCRKIWVSTDNELEQPDVLAQTCVSKSLKKRK